LLRHLWSMMQTRGEAAGLVLRLQRDALGRGLAWFAVAALAALGTPEEYRVAALAGLALALLVLAIGCVNGAQRRLARDKGLIADFTAGLRLDLAMVNLALKDPDPPELDRPTPDRPTPGVTAPEAMTRPRIEELAQHGAP
jgi:hypothetical protein